MTWTYAQKTGALDRNEILVGQGYSGKAEWKNNPDAQDQKNEGPIPRGTYIIEGPPYNTEKHGPYVLSLDPHPDNQMFGRNSFLIHGDSTKHPGEASEGCIIMPRSVRELVWESGDRILEVV